MFRAEGLAKSYGAQVALHPLELAVERGRTLVVIGPSGCGKTTLLRLLAGLDAPSAGRVLFDGQLMTRDAPPALRQRLGYVVQGGGLFPHLSARDNVTLVARHLRWDRALCDARVAELGALLRLEPAFLDRFPIQLSGGQAQRVSLMRALMLDPQALLLDEPLGALDPITRNELQADLRTVFRELGKTVVMVTHDLGEAAFLADRILLMRDGGVVQDGTAQDLLHSPKDEFVAKFVRAQRSPLDARGEP